MSNLEIVRDRILSIARVEIYQDQGIMIMIPIPSARVEYLRL
jgi:hypothetical protein